MFSAIQTSTTVVVWARSWADTSSRTEERFARTTSSSPASTGSAGDLARARRPPPRRPARKYGLSGSERRATKARNAGKRPPGRASASRCRRPGRGRSRRDRSRAGARRARRSRGRRGSGRGAAAAGTRRASTGRRRASRRARSRRGSGARHRPRPPGERGQGREGRVPEDRLLEDPRRPIRSASDRARALPTSEPASADARSSQSSRPRDPHSAAKTAREADEQDLHGHERPGDARDDGAPVEDVTPPSRRTSSTSRRRASAEGAIDCLRSILL